MSTETNTCPWNAAYDHATGAGFQKDLMDEGVEAATTMLQRRLGFLCLSQPEIDDVVVDVLLAAGLQIYSVPPAMVGAGMIPL